MHSNAHSGPARKCAGTPLTRSATAAHAWGCACLLLRVGAHLLVAQRPGGDQARAVAQRCCRARGRLARHLRRRRRAGPAPGASLQVTLSIPKPCIAHHLRSRRRAGPARTVPAGFPTLYPNPACRQLRGRRHAGLASTAPARHCNRPMLCRHPVHSCKLNLDPEDYPRP